MHSQLSRAATALLGVNATVSARGRRCMCGVELRALRHSMPATTMASGRELVNSCVPFLSRVGHQPGFPIRACDAGEPSLRAVQVAPELLRRARAKLPPRTVNPRSNTVRPVATGEVPGQALPRGPTPLCSGKGSCNTCPISPVDSAHPRREKRGSQDLDSTDRLDALSRQSLRQGKGQVSAFRVARGPTQGAERPEPGTTLIRTCCRCRCRNWLV